MSIYKKCDIYEQEENESSYSILDDHTWKGLDDVFELGIEDLSEKVDKILYHLNEGE